MLYKENDLVMIKDDIVHNAQYGVIYYTDSMFRPGNVCTIASGFSCGNDNIYYLKEDHLLRSYSEEMLIPAPEELIKGYQGKEGVYCAHSGVRIDPAGRFTIHTKDGTYFRSASDAHQEGYFKCCVCEEWTNDAEGTSDGDYVCSEECAEDGGYQRCDECGTWTLPEHAEYCEDGILYCSAMCANDNGLLRCDDCGEYYYEDEMNLNDHQQICEGCWDRHDYVTCDRCGDFICSDDSYGDDGYYCESCWDEMDDGYSDYIREYHDGPSILYNGEKEFWAMTTEEREDNKKTVFYGLEIETDHGNDRACYAEELYGISKNETLFFMESDGSLDDGVEIITQPMDWDHLQNFPFAKIHQIANRYGFKSHNTTTCGLHIHFSRAPFEEDMELFEAKLVYYFEKFEEEIEAIARRRYGQWCEGFKITNNDGKPGTTDEMIDKLTYLKGGHGDRYHSVNLTNDDTIEIRVFKGTLNEDTLLASVEFVKLATEYVNTHTVMDIQNADFLDTMNGMSSNLEDYLVLRGVKQAENTTNNNKEEIVCA